MWSNCMSVLYVCVYASVPTMLQLSCMLIDAYNAYRIANLRQIVMELNCSETYRFFQSQKLDMMANERFLDGAGKGLVTEICPELLTVTVLRAPLARVKSHFCEPPTVAACKLRPVNRTALATAEVWQMADNYMTRVLLGRNVYYSSFGSVTRHQLTQAQENLLQFDVVLTLERLTATNPEPGVEPERVQNVFGQTLGWLDVGFAQLNKETAGRVRTGDTCHSSFTAADDALISELNLHDQEVYDFAAALERLDMFYLGSQTATVSRATTLGFHVISPCVRLRTSVGWVHHRRIFKHTSQSRPATKALYPLLNGRVARTSAWKALNNCNMRSHIARKNASANLYCRARA